MYQRTERPLTADERDTLRLRLREANEHLLRGVVNIATLALFDGLLLVALVLTVVGLDGRLGKAVLGNLCAAMVLHGWLMPGALRASMYWVERRRVRATLADGVAVVEAIQASGVIQIDGRQLAAVEEGYVLVQDQDWPLDFPEERADPKQELHVFWAIDRVSSRAGGDTLTWAAHGLSSLPLTQVDLAEVVPDPERRRHLLDRLRVSRVLPGYLSDLEGLFAAAAQEHPPVTALGDGRWGRLQGLVEERFELNFGPNGLARLRPKTAGKLCSLVLDRLPADASVQVPRAVPMFLRLREAIAEVFGIDRHRLRPSTSLEVVIPRSRRLRRWRQVEERLGTPPLVLFGDEFTEGCGCFTVTLLVLLLVSLTYSQLNVELARALGADETTWFGHLGGTFMIPWVVLAMAILSFSVTTIARGVAGPTFMTGSRTLGEAARMYAGMVGDEETIAWTEENVWRAVRRLVARAAGITPGQVTRETPLPGS